MEINETDLLECGELKNYLDFIMVDTMPEDIPLEDRKWFRSKAYIRVDQNARTLYGVILMKANFGKYDEAYFRQELSRFFEDGEISIEFEEKKNNQIAFTVTNPDGIVVDDGRTLIPLFKSHLDTGVEAAQLKAVSHYTEIPKAEKILESGLFLAKSLYRYQSEKKFIANENSRKLLFDVCFTKNLENNEKMWECFAKDHRGCKVDFIFKHSLEKAFPSNRTLKCRDDFQKEYKISPTFSLEEDTLPCGYKVRFAFPEYVDSASESVTPMIYEDGRYWPYSVLQHAGRSISPNYKYQDEVRLLISLHSPERVTIPFIQTIEVPFESSEIEKIVVTVGENASRSAKQKIVALCANSSIYWYRNESETD